MSIWNSIQTFFNSNMAVILLSVAMSLGFVVIIILSNLFEKIIGSRIGTKKKNLNDQKNIAWRIFRELGTGIAFSAIGFIASSILAFVQSDAQLGKSLAGVGVILLVVAKVLIPVGAFVGKALAMGGVGEVGRRIMARFLRWRGILREPSDGRPPVPSRAMVDSTTSPPPEGN